MNKLLILLLLIPINVFAVVCTVIIFTDEDVGKRINKISQCKNGQQLAYRIIGDELSHENKMSELTDIRVNYCDLKFPTYIDKLSSSSSILNCVYRNHVYEKK